MNKQPKQTIENEAKATKKLNNSTHAGKNESEFAEELTKSEYKSAFQNPITGEERLY
ncbi:hypothetical protein D3C81_1455930 [compost metagenome]